MQQMTPKQLHDHLQQTSNAPLLLDVREADEYEICAIKGSINIPLSRLPETLEQCDPDRETVLICHHGIRSQRAGMYLEGHDFDKLINLVGGIDAWACDIDPDMPRY